MPVQSNQADTALWRRLVVCLAMATLLLGGIRLHALHFTSAADAAISSDHQSAKRQSFDSNAPYCVAPPRIFAFEPVPAAFFRAVQAQDVFLPALPDGSYFNRPPPSVQ